MIAALLSAARRIALGFWVATTPDTFPPAHPSPGRDGPHPPPAPSTTAGAGTPITSCPICGQPLICREAALELLADD